MSQDAFVFCRLRPELPEEGEFSGGRFPFELRSTTGPDADELRRCGGDPTTYPWVVAFEVSGEWYDGFLEGGSVIAQRCGGGLLWCALWTRPQLIAGRPATGSRSLFSAAERGFDEAGDEDVGREDEPPPRPAAPDQPRGEVRGSAAPSARALSHVLGMARSSVARNVVVGAQTLLAELGMGGDSWGTLLIGTDFDEFEKLDDPEWKPKTLEDVARIFDEQWAHDEARRRLRALSPPSLPPVPIRIGEQLAALEASRGGTEPADSAGAASHLPRVAGAELPGSRREPTAVWWTSPSREVTAVFSAVGGGPAGEMLAAMARDALTVPRGSNLRARTEWVMTRLDQALRPRLGPGFVASGSIASVGVSQGRAVVAHIGHVRVYRVSASAMECVTADHTFDAPGGGRATTRYLGAGVPLDYEVTEIELREGESLLVGTTGVFTRLDTETLAGLVRTSGLKAPIRIVARLRKLACDEGQAVVLVMGSHNP